MSNRPLNILLLVFDHQAYYRHGWDGGVRPLTPNFDRFAQSGVSFSRAYCATPLCGPARRSLLTGLYPHTHGQYYNYSEAPYRHEVYLETLALAGYQNIYLGKYHAGPGLPFQFGCRGFSDLDYGSPYTTPEYLAYLERHHLPAAEHYVERFFTNPVFEKLFPDLHAGQVYQCRRSWSGEHAVGLTLTPKETHESFFLAELACEQLEAIARNAGSQPFHMRVDFWGPHQPHFPTKEFADLYDPTSIPEYPSFLDALHGKPSVYFYDTNRPLSNDDNYFKVPSPLSWEEWQLIIARAYAHISMLDAAGGKILDRLDELGLAENTIVIWTTDHGDALASHGGRFDKGTYMTEEVLRVPLAVRLPGSASGKTVDSYVTTTDIPVTVLAAAGLQFAQPVHGANLLPYCLNDRAAGRESLMIETYGHGYGHNHPGRGILAGRYKYVTFNSQGRELYDLESDPYELNNLVDNPTYASVLQDLQLQLQEWQQRTDDPGFDDPAFDQAVASEPELLHQLAELRASIIRERNL